MKSGGNTGFAGVLGRVEEHKGNSVFDPFFAGKKRKGIRRGDSPLRDRISCDIIRARTKGVNSV